MNTKVTKSCGVKTKSGKNIQQKKSDVSRQPISKTNYLKTNLLKQIKKISLDVDYSIISSLFQVQN